MGIVGSSLTASFIWFNASFSLSYHRLPHGYAHSLVQSGYVDSYHSSRKYLYLNLLCILFSNNANT
jgi:hypothetical protein